MKPCSEKPGKPGFSGSNSLIPSENPVFRFDKKHAPLRSRKVMLGHRHQPLPQLEEPLRPERPSDVLHGDLGGDSIGLKIRPKKLPHKIAQE